MIGRVETSDEGSHTIDTTGSSSIAWRSGFVEFLNAGTTVKVGIAPVLTTAGPPGRAVHTADVIAFDVSKSIVGGGGGIADNAWQSHVPDTGTKTIAHGDLIAICIQMTARGGTDIVSVNCSNVLSGKHRPLVTIISGVSYLEMATVPNAVITFSDGTLGWISGAEVFSVIGTRTWNSGSATKEYGQRYQFPFPVKVYGTYGWIDPDADVDIVLYSDPLGTPVAERTLTIDANTATSTTGRRFEDLFSSPYSVPANTPVGIVFKPGASNVSAYYKTLGNAAHRITDPWGTSGDGIARASGAFASANSNLDQYLIGLITGGFDAGGGGGGRAVQVNATSLVA